MASFLMLLCDDQRKTQAKPVEVEINIIIMNDILYSAICRPTKALQGRLM